MTDFQSMCCIRGWGLVTPLGSSADETWNSLLNNQAICDHTPATLPRVPTMERVAQLALHAAREAIHQSGWTHRELSDSQTGVVIGTSKGPIESWLADLAPSTGTPGEGYARCSLFAGIADTAAEVAKSLTLGDGPRFTVSAACASSLVALAQATMLLRNGFIKRALVLGVESSLHPLFQGCFQRLGVLASPGSRCRPFDQNREGFHMSEAAAALCLEAQTSAAGIFVEDFAIGSAGVHLTSGDPSGATLRRLLQRVIGGKAVDLIQAHGTATVANDETEIAAIEDGMVSHPSFPRIYSHKGALGHSMGASGLISIVLNCLMHRRQIVLPNIHTRNPLPHNKSRIKSHTESVPVRRSIAIASGFGGPIAVVALAS